MKIQDKVTEASVGKTVELSTQELIALKDKWECIQNISLDYSDKGKFSKLHGRNAMENLIPLLHQMSNFMNTVTEGVQSTLQVHEELFGVEPDTLSENVLKTQES